jgi:hypothetical protein
MYECEREEHGWKYLDDNILKGYFLHFEDDNDDDCCLNINDFEWAVNELGGLNPPEPEECEIPTEK